MKTEQVEYTFTDTDFDVVEFNNQNHPRIKTRPMYFELGFSISPYIFGRRVLLDRLIQAIDFLPKEYGFLIWDIYRPRSVQRKLFNWMRKEICKKLPHLTDEENFNEARKYMSPPSRVGEDYCPPHLSGGAIDLTLYEIKTNQELEMGTPFDDCTERAHSHYFDFKSQLTSQEENIKSNRHQLQTVMEKVGFVSYHYEWWHFDLGDIFWSHKIGCSAVFGPLFGDEEWPKINP